jgi:hypothetical protein
MFKDERGILDSHERIWLNCGSLLIASAISAKLLEKNAHINSGSTEVLDITGEIVQLTQGTVIDGTVSYAGCFVIVLGNLVVQAKGMESLREATGVFIEDSLFYPASSDPSCLAKVKVQNKARAYPDDAQVVIGSYDLEKLVANAAHDKKHIWVSDTITALDEAPLAQALRDGLSFTAQSLFTYEGFNNTYKDLFTMNERTLVPDAYEVVESIKEGELILYGPKLYVKGDLTLSERDTDELAEKEAIIVNGRAYLPPACVKAFRRIGKAASYCMVDSSHRDINGMEEFTHALLQAMVQSGKRISVTVNGLLRFADDVTPEDMEYIRSLSYNGVVIISNEARVALEPRIRGSNGFIGESLESLENFAKSFGRPLPFGPFPFSGDKDAEGDADKADVTRINVGVFVL